MNILKLVTRCWKQCKNSWWSSAFLATWPQKLSQFESCFELIRFVYCRPSERKKTYGFSHRDNNTSPVLLVLHAPSSETPKWIICNIGYITTLEIDSYWLVDVFIDSYVTSASKLQHIFPGWKRERERGGSIPIPNLLARPKCHRWVDLGWVAWYANILPGNAVLPSPQLIVNLH
jgi:hypothetical protein